MQVAVVLVKSWQRLNNAQYVLKEHPELFSSFAAAYRRQCEPRARELDPARSCPPAPHPASTTRPTTPSLAPPRALVWHPHRWRARGGARRGRPLLELLGRPSQPAVVRICHGHPAVARCARPAGRPGRA
eukprot:scaffold140120_cov130-Phaeocystis_antarctica.AAC.1